MNYLGRLQASGIKHKHHHSLAQEVCPYIVRNYPRTVVEVVQQGDQKNLRKTMDDMSVEYDVKGNNLEGDDSKARTSYKNKQTGT